MLTTGGYTAVLPLGDLQYECGQLNAFNAVYDPTWGRVKPISRPVAGDNEYAGSACTTREPRLLHLLRQRRLPQEPGCTTACKGFYSYDLGSWHIVALNSEYRQAGVGGCGATSAQGRWLKADLAAHPAQCTLAYWHRPYWSDKGGTVGRTRYLVKTLYAAGAEVLLVGHQHI